MSNLSNIKQDIDVCKSLGDIIDVLKTAALIQIRIFQSKTNKPRQDFSEITRNCFNILIAKRCNHPYIFDRKEMPSAVVVVTSDEGFLGELNTLLVNAAAEYLKNPADELIVLGERGGKYFEDMGLTFTPFPGISEEMNFSEVERLRDYLLEGYKRKFGRIYIVYSRYVSLVLQKVETVTLLPVPLQEGLPPHISRALLDDMLIEPAERSVIENLTRLWAGYKLVELFWSAKLSEYGARIMHLEGSTQELQHQKHKLSFDYIRLMHHIKDKSIREISASKIMLVKKR